MTTTYRPSIGLAVLVLLSVAFAKVAPVSAKPPGSDGNARFPDVKDSWSPDGRFVLKNVDHREDTNSPHSIYLTDMQTGARTVLYSYLRTVDVLWSPSSDALAINDWDTNNQSQPVVLRLVPRQERIDVGEEALANDRRTNDHKFIHIIRWLDEKTLLLDVQSHGSGGQRSAVRLRKRIIY
jgi:hypothetical protein